VATGAVADLDESKHTVLLSGGAKLTTNEGSISSNEMTAHLGKGNAIESADARGAVKMDFQYADKEGVERVMQASADRATYTSTDRTVQLVGHVTAVIKEPANQRTLNMTADEITFWVDENRLRIQPAELVFTEIVTQKEQPAAAPKQ
jgi:lipopolysaccharide export system protein LptA